MRKEPSLLVLFRHGSGWAPEFISCVDQRNIFLNDSDNVLAYRSGEMESSI